MILPVRSFEDVLAATATFTVLPPMPLVLSNRIQLASVVAVQGPLAFTAMETVCASALTVPPRELLCG